jgi:hypothetical protein
MVEQFFIHRKIQLLRKLMSDTQDQVCDAQNTDAIAVCTI